MPFVGLVCPACDTRLPDRVTSFAHLWRGVHEKPIAAPGVIEAIWTHFDTSKDERRKGVHFTPSMAGGCMREYVITRVSDVWMYPGKAWKMLQGVLWHEVMAKYAPEGWRGEVEIPSARVAELITAGKVDYIPPYIRPRDGAVWEVEVLQGIWVSVRLDLVRVSHPWEIVDYKIKDCPPGWRDKSTGELTYASGAPLAMFKGYVLQQNLYGRAVAKTYELDYVPRLTLASNYAGMQDTNRNWEFETVPELSEQQLLAEIHDDVSNFKTYAREAEREGVVAVRPMALQGLTMFGGKKCTKYCAVAKICAEVGTLQTQASPWEL